MRTSGRIASVGVAAPPYAISQREAKEFMVKHYSDKLSERSLKIMRNIFEHPSVSRRHFAFQKPEELIDEDADSRIARFTRWAVDLSERAASAALSEAGICAADVAALTVNTCTGYLCPGLSSYIIERLGLRDDITAYDLVGSGCGGAIPNLQICERLLDKAGGGAVLSVSVEICSATFKMEDDLSLVISNALFADGAGAAVIWNRPQGLAMVASASRILPQHRDAIRYIYKNGELQNQLSPELPALVSRTVGALVRELLGEHGLRVEDIRGWALHAGGGKIVEAVKDELGLSEEQLEAPRRVLAEYGNISSATVWFVIKELLEKKISEGDWCVMLSFGAGFSAHIFLLKLL